MITINQIASYSSLEHAYEIISKKSKVAGVDGITPRAFGMDLKQNLKELSWALKSGVYTPAQFKKWTMKQNGKEREMGLLTCSDRIVATALSNALGKLIKDSMSNHCYAYRSGKSALEAVGRIASLVQSNYIYYLRTDIENFFESIDHSLLIEKIKDYFDDASFQIVMKMIDNSGSNGKGLALGSVLSPVLSNIYLMELDCEVESRSDVEYLRFADDIIILGQNNELVEKGWKILQDELIQTKLDYNEKKTFRGCVENGFDFLGFHFDGQGIKASQKAEEMLSECLYNEWMQNAAISTDERLDAVIKRINGWKAYYRNKITGNHLGVAAMIKEGKVDCQDIIAYRETLSNDDLVMNTLIAEQWMIRHEYRNALKEYENFLDLGVCDGTLPEKNLLELIHLYQEYFKQWDNEVLISILHIYSDCGLYQKADQLSKYVNCQVQKGEIVLSEGIQGFQNECLIAFIKLFFNNRKAYRTECLVEDNRRIVFREGPVSLTEIKRHFAGELTLDTESMDDDYKSDFLVFDIDIEKGFYLQNAENKSMIQQQSDLAENYANKIVKTIHGFGGESYVEDSGGYGRHVWIFFDEGMQYQKIAEMGNAILHEVGVTPESIQIELFPPNRSIKLGQSKPSIKIPFGTNVRTGKRSYMKTLDGRIIGNWKEGEKLLLKTSVQTLRKNIGKIKRIERCSKAYDDDYRRLGKLSKNVEQIVENCSIMRQLCLKAFDTHFLNHFERLSLLYVFGHLGEEGEQFLHNIIGKTLDYKRATTEYFIKKCPERPVSCNKLRRELIGLGSSNCHCDFEIAEGCYASPVLHAIHQSTFEKEDKMITLPVRRNTKEEKVVEFYNVRGRFDELIISFLKTTEEISKLESEKDEIKIKIQKILSERGGGNLQTPYGSIINDHQGRLALILE